MHFCFSLKTCFFLSHKMFRSFCDLLLNIYISVFSQNFIHVLPKVLVLCRVLHFSEPLEISKVRFVKRFVVKFYEVF